MPGSRHPSRGCSLAEVRPDVAAEWHPTRNEGLTPSQVSHGTTKRAWWLGACGHEWQASVNNRSKVNGTGCSVCGGRTVLAGFNDLEFLEPSIAAEWHPTRNEGLLPSQVTSGATKVVWWLGACGHEWQASVNNRSKVNGSGCSVCGGRTVLAGFNDLEFLEPSIAAEWHPTRNEGLLPSQVTRSSGRKVWWLGGCGHEWQTQVYSRVSQKQGCPFCAGKKVLAGFNDLEFLEPSIAAEWHPTRNEGLSPSQVTRSSGRKVWWLGACGHEWQAQVAMRTPCDGSGCPFCAGKKVLAGFNDLEFLEPSIAAEWHPTRNDGLLPSQVTSGSKKRVWWLGVCGHEWDITVDARARRGYGCPVCDGRRVMVGVNDLASVRPDVSDLWHPTRNDGLLASGVVVNSAKRVWWLCPVGHEWEAQVYNRTAGGSGCPDCRLFNTSRAEIVLRHELGVFTVVEAGRVIVVDGVRWSPDVVLPELGVVVEYDGSYWHRGLSTRKRDVRKVAALMSVGWRVIRAREVPLDLLSDADVVVCSGEHHGNVVAVLERLVGWGLLDGVLVGEYAAGGVLVAEAAADVEVAERLSGGGVSMLETA